MNFDQTYIAIRKRNVLEIFDLALLVIRDHFRPLLILWLIGTVPFYIANGIAIRWMAVDLYDPELLTLYFWTMVLLVSNQAQVATTFMSSYLGQAIFSQRPSVAVSIRSTFGVSPYYAWVHGILRMVVPVFLTVCLLDRESAGDVFGGVYFLLICLTTAGLIVRCNRPFASEILLLEKTPIRRRGNAIGRNQIHYSLRSSSLHKAAHSELIGRFILMSLLGIPVTITFLGSLLLVDSSLNLHPNSGYRPLVIYGPIALWFTAGIMAVVRFLSYIDIRIRQEGWEVELRLRAEAIRLEKALGL